MKQLQCAMSDSCHSAVTHLGDRGFVYCKTHGVERRRGCHESTRRLRVWELNILRAGEPLISYAPAKRKPSIIQPLAHDIAWAASTDAGNRSMREAGRTAWSEEDYNAACAELERLGPIPTADSTTPQNRRSTR